MKADKEKEKSRGRLAHRTKQSGQDVKVLPCRCDGEEVQKQDRQNPENIAFVMEWRILFKKKGDHVKHTYRVHNQEADHMANLGSRRSFEDQREKSEKYRDGTAARNNMEAVDATW